MRKKVLIAGVLSAVTVAAGAYGIFNMLDVSSSKANFQKTAKVESTVQAGKLEFTVSKLTGLDVSKALETYDGSGITLGNVVGNTTNGMVVDEKGTYAKNGIVSYMEDFANISPGWKNVYGFEVKNTGTLDEYLNLYIGTAHITGGTPETWDEQDPRARIKYTIYQSETRTGSYTVAATGTLDTQGYNNVQIPGKVTGTDVLLKAEVTGNTPVPAGTSYYIVCLEFTEKIGIYAGRPVDANINILGDNVYQNSKIKVNLSIGTTGPTADNYEVPTGTN